MDYILNGPNFVRKGRQVDYQVVPAEAVSYNWEVSRGGKIIDGQDMPAITVEWNETGPQEITVAVERHDRSVLKQKFAVEVSDNVLDMEEGRKPVK